MGLFDQSYGALLDPQTSGILSAAFSGLQASGPQRMPVSLGQVFGQAGQAGLGAYQQAQQQAVTQNLMRLHGALYQAQIEKMNQQAEMTRQMMSGGFGANLQSKTPEQLDMMGEMALANHVPGGATFLRLAEQKRAQAANASALSGMRETEGNLTPEGSVAGTNQTVPNIPQSDLPAFQAVARAAAMGQPSSASPDVVTKGRTGGLFAPFLMSANPAIRRQALALQTQLNSAPDTMPAKYWEDKAAELGKAETAIATRPEPMKIVLEPGGRSVYVPQSRVAGMEAGSPTGNRSTTGVDPASASLHGEPYLSTLDPTTQNIVRKVVNYELPPTDLSSRSGDRKNIEAHAIQTDPNWNAQKYGARFKLRNDFYSGPTSNNIVALDQALNHMGTLKKLSDALQNNNVKGVNLIVNTVRDQIGDPRINNAQLAKQAVATELMRVFRQVNADESEVKRFEEKLNAAMLSPAQMNGALSVGAKLLAGRISAINNKWNKGMETKGGFPGILSPEAENALSILNTSPSVPSSSSGGWKITPVP